MPEAPPEADALVAAEHELPAHLADGEVQERRVARRAGESCGAAENLGRAGGEVVAECAGEEVVRSGCFHAWLV